MSQEKVSPPDDEELRKVTASDVALKAGVSKWTVSRAFTDGASVSPWARERIIQVAAELGYRPNLLARGLKKRRTHIVGLVVDELANPNLLLVLDEITRRLQREGYLSMLLNITSEHSRGSALSLADQFQVDGLIFLGTVLTDELVKLAQDIRHIPLIVLYRNSDDPDIQVVTTDGYRGGSELAALLLEQRYRRIGYMAGPVSESTQLKRIDGLRDVLSAAGLGIEVMLQAGHYRRECGQRAMLEYLNATPAPGRIEALFCENDVLAMGAIDALRARGESRQIAIVGFDDIEMASAPSYDITTYRQPLEALVSEAVRRLIAGNAPQPKCFINGTLVKRSSHLRFSGPA